ncbi:hypothetical protein [Pseudoalteromonas phage vB_PalP_Y7]|nr:hypothetical protein [Pseudoalteromonas phage vB_PalP_Y7]
MINTAIANKVTTGSCWLPMVDKRMPQAILDAGEVEVYKTVKEIDPDSVIITVIYGEGETSEFDLFVFIEMFVPKYMLSRTTYDKPVTVTSGQELMIEPAIAVDWGSCKQDKAAYAVMCMSCGGIISEVNENAPAIPHTNIYECARCATVTSYQENSPILSAVKRLQIESRLAAMGITEPPPVESDVKTMGRLELFLNKDPMSMKEFTLRWSVLAALSLIVLFTPAPDRYTAPILLAILCLSLAFIGIDMLRTRNKFYRWLDNQMK